MEGIHFVFADLTGVFDHLIHQVIGIDYGAFAGFHLTVRKFDHAVGEMDEFFAEGESKSVEKDGEHFEMVLLLVTYHIDHLVDGEILETQFGGTDILGHIDGSAVRAEQQFLVESVFGKVCPYRTVFTAVELSGRKTFLHFGLTFEIGV